MCNDEPCKECQEKDCEKQPLFFSRPDSITYAEGVYTFKGNDTMTPEELKQKIAKEYAGLGLKEAPPLVIPAPDPGDVPARVPDFVEPQDKLLVWLATLMYKPLPEVIPGATLDIQFSSSRIGVWTNDSTAYVGFRGTDVTASDRSADLFDDLAIATGETCDLSITTLGVSVITQLYNKGFNNIQLCGHSLGGRAALCCGVLPGVTKVVVLNAAAPFLKLVNVGPGETIATHYHIFGDLISSHLQGAKNIRVRVGPEQYLHRNDVFFGREQIYDVDWLSPYYHSTDRFLSYNDWEYSTPQEEQNSLEYYFFDTRRGAMELLSLLASSVGGQFAVLIKTRICSNTVPGSTQYRFCKRENGDGQKILNSIMVALGSIAGSFQAFREKGLKGVPEGANAGAQFTQGNIGPVLERYFPGFSYFSNFLKNWLKDLFITLNNQNTSELSQQDLIKQILGTLELPEIKKVPDLVDSGVDTVVSTIKQTIENHGQKVYGHVKKKVKTVVKKVSQRIENKIDKYLSPDGEKLPLVEALKKRGKQIVKNKATEIEEKAKKAVKKRVNEKIDQVATKLKRKNV